MGVAVAPGVGDSASAAAAESAPPDAEVKVEVKQENKDDEAPRAAGPSNWPKMPACSHEHPPPPTEYNGGTIYCSYPKKTWRAIRTQGVYASEKAMRWGGQTPTISSWVACLRAIDEARASGY